MKCLKLMLAINIALLWACSDPETSNHNSLAGVSVEDNTIADGDTVIWNRPNGFGISACKAAPMKGSIVAQVDPEGESFVQQLISSRVKILVSQGMSKEQAQKQALIELQKSLGISDNAYLESTLYYVMGLRDLHGLGLSEEFTPQGYVYEFTGHDERLADVVRKDLADDGKVERDNFCGLFTEDMYRFLNGYSAQYIHYGCTAVSVLWGDELIIDMWRKCNPESRIGEVCTNEGEEIKSTTQKNVVYKCIAGMWAPRHDDFSAVTNWEVKKSVDDYLNSDVEYGSFTDIRDGEVYKTVVVKGQTWMAENMRFAGEDTSSLQQEYYDKYSACLEDSCQAVGRFYGFGEFICPDGWRLPNRDDIEKLAQGRCSKNLFGRPSCGWQDYFSKEGVLGGDDDFNTSGLSFVPAGYVDLSYFEDETTQYVFKGGSMVLWMEGKADSRGDYVAQVLFATKDTYEVRELDAEGSYDDKHHVHAQVRCVKE